MKQNGEVCQPMLLFFTFQFDCVFSGPKSYQDFREMGPGRHVQSSCQNSSPGPLQGSLRCHDSNGNRNVEKAK